MIGINKGSVFFKLTLDKNSNEQSNARNSIASDYTNVRVERVGERVSKKKLESSEEICQGLKRRGLKKDIRGLYKPRCMIGFQV